MVPPDKGLAQVAHPLNYLIGCRSIAHHIAQVPHHFVRWRSIKRRLQSVDIGMNVGKDESAHTGLLRRQKSTANNQTIRLNRHSAPNAREPAPPALQPRCPLPPG